MRLGLELGSPSSGQHLRLLIIQGTFMVMLMIIMMAMMMIMMRTIMIMITIVWTPPEAAYHSR